MQRQWARAFCAFAISCVVVGMLFWQTARTMVDVWIHSRTFAHGLLVLPATVYMAWCYRDRLVRLYPVPNYWGMVLFVTLSYGWLGGELTKTLIAQQIVLIAMLPALVWTFFGTDVFRTLRFPLGFLVFALPVGTSIEPWLQSVTTRFITIGLELVGIPLSRDGYFITIPSGIWEVAPDCGGLRYLLPGLALGYVYTGVMHGTLRQRVIFLFVCTVALIIANGARAYGIILGNHLGIAEGTDHRVFSYSVYGITVLFLGWQGLRWSDDGMWLRTGGMSETGPRSRNEGFLRHC